VDASGVVGDSYPIHTFADITSTVGTLQVGQSTTASVSTTAVSQFLTSAVPQKASSRATTSALKVEHYGKNVVPHLMSRTSDYWVVDTYSDAIVLKHWPEKVGTIQVLGSTKPRGSYYINSTTTVSGIDTPYQALSGTFSLPLGEVLLEGEAGDNPLVICADDLTPPVVDDTVPAAWSNLNPVASYIEFSVADAVGGVDLSTLAVTVSGNITTQPEPIQIVAGGVDQTGGKVSIGGDPARYLVRYTPSLSWGYNETVTVSIDADDIEPTSEGSPWSCSTPGIVNSLSDEYTVKMLNQELLSCQIVGLPDTAPPAIFYEVPAASSTDNVAETAVSLYILDDTFGVSLSSVYVVVDSVPVVTAGLAATAGTTVVPVSNGYYVSYTPASPFEYGSEIVVQVIAKDSSVASNLLDTSYSFWTVSDTTLVVENFSPEVGVSYLAATKNLSVDVYDSTFGIDDTYFIIDGTVTSGTRAPLGGVGYTLTYHPSNDFDVQGYTSVSVFARNGNVVSPVVKTVQYNLYHGYRVLESNYEVPRGTKSFDISVRAGNTSTFTSRLSSIYRVSVYDQPASDFGASITAVVPWASLGASMTITSPTHSYGELIDVEVYVEDKDGNSFGPYTFYYTIESSP